MENKKVDIFKLFKSEGILVNLLVYPAKESINDPYEKTTTTTFLNPIAIKALVHQLGMGALKWKYWGNLPAGSIQIICEPQYYNLIILASKIEYNNNTYYLYKDDSKRFSVIQRQDYVMAILERKT